MDYEIRESNIEELGDIIDLNQKLFYYEFEYFDQTLDCEWPERHKDYFKKSIENESSLTLVAISNNHVIGYLIGKIGISDDYRNVDLIAEIENMFILPEFRGKEIGTALCKRFFEWAKIKGIKKSKVEASASNKKAIDYYKKNGFNEYNIILERDL